MPAEPLSEPRVAFVTLGCPKNEVDSDRMEAAAIGSGLSITTELEEADVVVVNTCAFIQAATEESIETVLGLAAGWASEREGRRIVATGCMVSRYGDELADAMPEVAALLSVAEEGRLAQVIGELFGTDVPELDDRPRRAAAGPAAYLQVSDGCHRACAFCTIPSIRGPYRSTPLDRLVEEAMALASAGARELTLVGQDISAWGRDLPGTARLADLVRELAEIDGVDWVRLMYVQPDGVGDDLLETMAATPEVCHYLDLPLQHASEAVLRRMGRSGSEEAFLDLLSRIRAALPDVALRTTLIAGYPGETREDIRVLESFLDEARFDYVGVFAYSPEDGTPAADLPDQVPARTRRARAQRLRDRADEIGFARALERVGTVLDVLVEGYDEEEDVVVGRWRGQAPDIDGVVLLDGGEPGGIVPAAITDAFGYDLEGELVP